MKVCIDFFCNKFIYPGNELQVLEASKGRAFCRPEMRKEGFFAGRADAWNFIKAGGYKCFSPFRPMGSNREPMGLVTKPL